MTDLLCGLLVLFYHAPQNEGEIPGPRGPQVPVPHRVQHSEYRPVFLPLPDVYRTPAFLRKLKERG